MHRTEPSRLQSLSLQLSDKIAQMVDNNERLLEFRGYQGGGGGGWRGRDRGGGGWQGERSKFHQIKLTLESCSLHFPS